MWNSWVDIDIIQLIKKSTNESKDWFYIKKIRSSSDRDRMENEELVTSISYLEYMKKHEPEKKVLDIYQKTERINARIIYKAHISSILQLTTENEIEKRDFQAAIKDFDIFLRKLRFVLLDKDTPKDKLYSYLSKEMDVIFKAGKLSRNFRRRKQDFYILWQLLNRINIEMVKYHRLAMKKEIQEIFVYMKNIPENEQTENQGCEKFLNMCKTFTEKYQADKRCIRLSEEEKEKLLKSQDRCSPISQSIIFQGDDVEVDHIVPLATGGKDDSENLQLVHKDENRKKSSNRI